MTANHEHTPTVDELRRMYALKVPHDQRDRRNAEFDRFVTAAEQRGAIKALREFADSHRMPFVMFRGENYTVTVSDLLRETARDIEQEIRADQEGDDGDA